MNKKELRGQNILVELEVNIANLINQYSEDDLLAALEYIAKLKRVQKVSRHSIGDIIEKVIAESYNTKQADINSDIEY